MPDRLKPAVLMLVLAALGACHNDPFSVKPEVNVTLPDKPASEAPPPEDPEEALPSGGSEGTNTP